MGHPSKTWLEWATRLTPFQDFGTKQISKNVENIFRIRYAAPYGEAFRMTAEGWNVGVLCDELEQKYHALRLNSYWKDERPRIEKRLTAISTELATRYADPHVQGVGGSGIVLRVADTQLSRQLCAVKFPRPVPGKTELISGMMKREISYLALLRHRSVVRIHGSNVLREDAAQANGKGQQGVDAEFPYYVMDFVSGSSSAKYLREQHLGTREFVSIIYATIDALAYLHQNSVAHLDIKPENVLVGSDGVPVIADLGTAKALTDNTGVTIVACTYGYADPMLIRKLESDPSDENRAKGEIPRVEIDLKWDLFSLGKTILYWLGFDVTSGEMHVTASSLGIYERKYLLLMAARLLHGNIDQWLEDRIGIDRKVLAQLSYTEMRHVRTDIRKLSGDYSILDYVPELNAYHPKTLQVTRETPTTYTDRTEKLLNHPSVRRLATVTQLGLINQVYPTGTHSRLEHSLGTFHNTCRFVLSLYYDPFSPLFRQIVEAQDICAVLVSALLHDVGQFPLAHDLEEIDATLFSHKQLGTAVIKGVRDLKKPGSRRIQLTPLDDVLKAWEVLPERVIEILNAKPEDEDASLRDRLLHSVVDGPIDADKLDYLRRDSERLGVPYGNGIDVERVLRSLTVILERRGRGIASVGVHEKAKVAAEFVAIARYAMFSQAYWQHSVRAMKAMLTRSILQIVGLLEDQGERARNAFRTAFEALVLSLPGVDLRGATCSTCAL